MQVNQKLITTVFTILLAGFISASAQNTTQFDQLKSAFQDDRVFTASFAHKYSDSFTGEQQRAEGTIWIGKNQYKITGSNQQMVVDGEVSRVYDETRNRVIISEYVEDEDDFAPSRMLQGVDSSYTVTEQTENGGQTLITLTSEDPFSVFLKVLIYLDQDGNPLKIQAEDQAENMLTTTFYSGKFVSAAPDLFNLVIPDGAEFIDLRHES